MTSTTGALTVYNLDIVTTIGFGMKRERYEDVHRAAIRWPLDSFDYIGIDNEGNTDEAYSGEKLYGLEPFKKDLYGCRGVLLEKRKKRNPYRRFHPYHNSGTNRSSVLPHSWNALADRSPLSCQLPNSVLFSNTVPSGVISSAGLYRGSHRVRGCRVAIANCINHHYRFEGAD